ncbi:hypothetical protein AX17_005646 [Amanita inopinata Kibby_2008]|nr:hypothetical protein AX17_005646 [Amanita inopinata Kibby_2008]
MPRKSARRKKNEHTESDSESDSDGSRPEDWWRPSPSPEETFSGAEGANSDGEWAFEIVGEEVNCWGEIKYEVKWDNWARPDGTNTTWDNSLIPGSAQAGWNRSQGRVRANQARKSLSMPIPKTIDIVDTLSFLRSHAFEEKLQRRKALSLQKQREQKMNALMADASLSSLEKTSPDKDHNDEDDVKSPMPSPPSRGHRRSARLWQSLNNTASTSKVKLDNPVVAPRILKREWTVERPTPTSNSTKDLKFDFSPPEIEPCVPKKRGRPSLRDKPTPNLLEEKKLIVSPPPKVPRVPRKFRLEERCDDTPPDSPPFLPKKKRKIMRCDSPALERGLLASQWTKIAEAAGARAITISNDVDDESVPILPSDFQYLETGYIYCDDVPRKDDLDDGLFIKCDCTRCYDPATCDCQSVSALVDQDDNKIMAYDPKGFFVIDVAPGLLVIECNKFCHCDISCPNRVSQRPRNISVDIFKTKERGWGARSLHDIEQGTVLGMYSGKRSMAEALEEGEKGFCFDLDGQEDPHNEEHQVNAYTVDARTCGNWTRFINHSCLPNLQVYQVVHDTIPENYTPYIIFYAMQDIPAKSEFTVDYDPSAGDYEVKVKRKKKGKGKKKWGKNKGNKEKVRDLPPGAILCKCDEETCRGWVRVLS